MRNIDFINEIDASNLHLVHNAIEGHSTTSKIKSNPMKFPSSQENIIPGLAHLTAVALCHSNAD
jgi:imidazoleglycerol phosphate synthase glutamine amidotransferase subunit HisH